MPQLVLIRTASPNDYLDIARLRALSLGLPEDSLQLRFKAEFERFRDADRWNLWTAWLNEILIGYGRTEVLTTDNNPYETTRSLPVGWYLRGIVVHPSVRRQGIARELTVTRLKWLSQRTSVVFCFLDAEEKASVPLYLSLGFTEVSRDWDFRDLRDDRGVLLQRTEPC